MIFVRTLYPQWNVRAEVSSRKEILFVAMEELYIYDTSGVIRAISLIYGAIHIWGIPYTHTHRSLTLFGYIIMLPPP